MKKHLQTGFTLIEMLVVVAVIGIVLLLAAPSLSNVTTGATAKQVYDFTQTANRSWRLANMKCGTTNDTATSPIVATPSVTNSLALIINGTTYLNAATYQGCWDEAAIQSLHTKATGNPTDGFKVAGMAVTWSGGSGSSPIKFVIASVPTEIALPLYKQYSSAAGAQTATAMPAVADTTDPMIQYTLPAAGVTTLTLLFN